MPEEVSTHTTADGVSAPIERVLQESAESPHWEEQYLAMSADGEHPQLIAHAGGAVFGYRLTNSLEAFDNAYQNGFRYIETDMSLTDDGHIVLIHDWESMAKRMLFSEGIRSRDGFLESETLADLTLLDLKGLLEWLSAHPDCYVITDIKETANCELLGEIRNQAGPDMFKRFVPQVYTYEEYQTVKDLGYERIILTLYRLNTNADELGAFVKETRPWAVTVPESRIDEELLETITACGVAVYAHTVNSLDFVDVWAPFGLTGIYTDYFVPCRWVY